MQTAERSSGTELSDNFVFQRHKQAYEEAAKLIQGKMLEIGCGMGHGTKILLPKVEEYTGIDKFTTDTSQFEGYNYSFKQMHVPPFKGVDDNSFDFVVTFQVIEHIEEDYEFTSELHRVLKPGGKLILTTPNIRMSLTRNPWHVREYTLEQLEGLVSKYFDKVEMQGVYGNDKIMSYYNKNKASVEKITRWDILNLQYNLPRQVLQFPYDILNRMNRKKLMNQNTGLVNDILSTDYHLDKANDECFDFFVIATK